MFFLKVIYSIKQLKYPVKALELEGVRPSHLQHSDASPGLLDMFFQFEVDSYLLVFSPIVKIIIA